MNPSKFVGPLSAAAPLAASVQDDEDLVDVVDELDQDLDEPAAVPVNGFEQEVIVELNRVRADPAGYAAYLQRERAQKGVSNDERADPHAFPEAVEFLKKQAPLPPLAADNRLSDAAFELAKAQGPTGAIGHGPNGNLGQRIQARGVWAGLSGETISYGQPTPYEVVRQLVVDFGVADRGHREMIFDATFQAAGVGCGRHAQYGEMCVIDFAGAFPQR
jgi:uncharacterized protein YkwD